MNLKAYGSNADDSSMTDAAVVDVATQMMFITAKLCAPVLITALIVGFAISLFQSATQIQEQTLSFVPKMICVGAALVFSGNWMIHELVRFTHELFEKLPGLLGQA